MAYRKSPVDPSRRQSGGGSDTPERRKRETAQFLETQRKGRDSVISNMMRLRALRLAKEEAEAKAAPAPAAAPASTRKSGKLPAKESVS
ncbi:MAG: hypothetical protein Q8S29_21420 [Phreatobacter sp.]|nr:hypothetical protein [Phreatobacter sp.]